VRPTTISTTRTAHVCTLRSREESTSPGAARAFPPPSSSPPSAPAGDSHRGPPLSGGPGPLREIRAWWIANRPAAPRSPRRGARRRARRDRRASFGREHLRDDLGRARPPRLPPPHALRHLLLRATHAVEVVALWHTSRATARSSPSPGHKWPPPRPQWPRPVRRCAHARPRPPREPRPRSPPATEGARPPRPRPPRLPARAADTHIDPARKRHYDSLLATMQSSRRTEASGFDAYWEAVGAILSSNLWAADGYSDAKTWIRTVIKLLSARSAAWSASPATPRRSRDPLRRNAARRRPRLHRCHDRPHRRPLAAPLRQAPHPRRPPRQAAPRALVRHHDPEVLAATREVLKGKGRTVRPRRSSSRSSTRSRGRRRSSAWYRGSETGTWCSASALKGLDALLKALRGVKWRRGSRASRDPPTRHCRQSAECRTNGIRLAHLKLEGPFKRFPRIMPRRWILSWRNTLKPSKMARSHCHREACSGSNPRTKLCTILSRFVVKRR